MYGNLLYIMFWRGVVVLSVNGLFNAAGVSSCRGGVVGREGVSRRCGGTYRFGLFSGIGSGWCYK